MNERSYLHHSTNPPAYPPTHGQALFGIRPTDPAALASQYTFQPPFGTVDAVNLLRLTHSTPEGTYAMVPAALPPPPPGAAAAAGNATAAAAAAAAPPRPLVPSCLTDSVDTAVSCPAGFYRKSPAAVAAACAAAAQRGAFACPASAIGCSCDPCQAFPRALVEVFAAPAVRTDTPPLAGGAPASHPCVYQKPLACPTPSLQQASGAAAAVVDTLTDEQLRNWTGCRKLKARPWTQHPLYGTRTDTNALARSQHPPPAFTPLLPRQLRFASRGILDETIGR